MKQWKKNWRKTAALLSCAVLMTGLAACDDGRSSAAAAEAPQSPGMLQADDNTASTVSAVSETTTATTATATAAPTTTTTAATTTTAPKLNSSYEITSKTCSNRDGSIQFTYPQIKGLSNKKMQRFYNELFASDCENAVNQKDLENFSGTYEVTRKSAEQLSIVFRCSCYRTGGILPNYDAYAYTIDLKTGETVIPSRKLDDTAVGKFISQKWTRVKGAEGIDDKIAEYYTPLDADAVKEIFIEEGVLSVRKDAGGDYFTEGTERCRSYLNQKGKPVLIVSIGCTVNDYAEIQF